MFIYSLSEMAAMLAVAIAIDWIIGDPPWPTHPVILIGRWIRMLEKRLHPAHAEPVSPAGAKAKGIVLALSTVMMAGAAAWFVVEVCRWVHPWLGYAANTWLISTTVAIKGLKQAAYKVYRPLSAGNLQEARTYVGHIVGRETGTLDEREVARATVETVAENIVDAVVSPLAFALLGGAPLAMLYRAANTLDSMVGYRSERYLHFGWASARLDDVLNWVPARVAGLLLALIAACRRGMSGRRAAAAVLAFAGKHPSPNSGIPESAVAGALGIELGGRNVYGGQVSERARMGWPLRPMQPDDIRLAASMLYGVSYLLAGGLACVWIVLNG